jgi:alpha-L-rhamnosidase
MADQSSFRRTVSLTGSLLLLSAIQMRCIGAQTHLPGRPSGLTVDSLAQPLGIDSPKPLLSWKLQDGTTGAVQTAYEVLVSTRRSPSGVLTGDVWDSGRIASSQSVNIAYAGKDLKASTRYYWQVRVWGKDGKPYPLSTPSWWETGLLTQAAWTAKWIGYEEPELAAVRHSGVVWITNAAAFGPTQNADTSHDFRLGFSLSKSVKKATLYTAGEDTVAAWMNGAQVLQAYPLSPYKHMPWQTYVFHDVTTALRPGPNQLAIGVTHYYVAGNAPITQVPMSACLYLLFDDGTTQVITSADPGWKAAFNAPDGWHNSAFNDAAWKPAVAYHTDAPMMGDASLPNPTPTDPVMLLRHSFSEAKPVASARLYATALGAYKFHINSKVVGDQILSPGWMDFRQHVPYQVYDVTAEIQRGDNAIAAFLAPGWYSTPLMWMRRSNNYGDTPPAVKAQQRIEHTDGSVEWIGTDDTWKADVSPVLFAEIYDGETYDARRVQPGWDTATFSDAKWHSASVIAPHEPEIVSQYFEPIREEQVLTAKSITNPSPGVYIYDFGQNMSGVPRVTLRGKRGDDIQLRFAEVLNPDGSLYVDNLRTAKATDRFILAGGPNAETYQPQFTYHGYRYIEVTGLAAKPGLDAVRAVVFHTAAPFTTQFASGDGMVNKLWSNILWGQRSNFIGVPTDCPQRDERLGWTADAQVFWRTASYNMDLDNFTRKFSADMRGTQIGTTKYGIIAPGTSSPNPGYGAGWSDAGVVIPWTGWMQTGDDRIVDENWDAMEKYLATILDDNPDYLFRKNFGTPFGDWLTPTQTTPEDLIATAYWAYDVTLMKQMAAATGRTEKAAEYTALFEKIKAAFIKAYVRPDGFVGSIDNFPSIPPPTVKPEPVDPNRPKAVVETQTGYVLALYFGLVPQDLRQAATDRLIQKIKDNHWLLGTGFLGTPYLLEVLADNGHSDLAYRLLLNRQYPSWGYLIDHGATTTWERWNGDQMLGDPAMNSYNHYAYGAVAAWIYGYAAGVDGTVADPGFHTVYLHPHFDSRLGNMNFSYESSYGTVVSNWKVTRTNVVWTVTVPPNTTGLLPVDATNASGYLLDGIPVASSPKVHAEGANTYRIPAGTYTFHASVAPSATDMAAK